MRKFIAGVVLCFALSGPALAQTAQPSGGTGAVVQNTGGGIIDIGQAFGTIAAPYINAAVNALILAAIGWACTAFQKKTGIAIDQGNRDALTRGLQNQAGSLLADGEVKLQGAKVSVGSAAMAAAVNDLLKSLPDVEKHFGLTPEYVEKRIIDTIPQVPAGAAMIAGGTSPAAPDGGAAKA